MPSEPKRPYHSFKRLNEEYAIDDDLNLWARTITRKSDLWDLVKCFVERIGGRKRSEVIKAVGKAAVLLGYEDMGVVGSGTNNG